MNINKNNFQECLLLYIDGELSIDESYTVEQYIEQNDFAKAELDLLMQTKLDFTSESFEDIEALLKQENAEININNYTEKFALYVDDEMTKKEKKQVETFVLKHPKTQEDFTNFNKTKLENITIAHPNKAELYKKEKTVLFYIQRCAVAATIVGIAAFAWISFSKNNNVESTNNIAQVNTAKENNATNNNIQNTTTTTIDNNEIVKNNDVVNKIKAENNNNEIAKTNVVNNGTEEKNNNKIFTQNPSTNNISVAQNNSSNSSLNNNTITNTPITNTNNVNNNLASNNNNTQSINHQNTSIQNNANNNNIKPSISENTTAAVVYKNLEEDEEDNARAVQAQPSKLRSLFNKATSIINIEGKDDASKKVGSITLR